MLGNDQYGDCGVAGLQHTFMAAANITQQKETFATAAQAIAYYLKYTGGVDSGVVLSQYLAYVRANGYYGSNDVLYAPFSPLNTPALLDVTFLYGSAYCGITVTDAMMSAFQAGEPWTADLCDSPIDGGHCVPVVGYDDQWLTIVTWGQLQKVSYLCWSHIASEGWAIITDDLVKANGDGIRGINLAALKSDLTIIGG